MNAAISRCLVVFVLASATSIEAGQSMREPERATVTSKKDKNKDKNDAVRTPVLWRDPGVVENLDFVGGAGGRENAPKPPFRFVEENLAGSSPKIKLTDRDGTHWTAKWGGEAKPETFATRIAWAAGYFVEPAYYVKSGRIDGIPPHTLKRAKKYIGVDGTFADARFELKEKGVKRLQDEQSWRWDENPFVGTPELHGLMILVMLLSNFDNKDSRDTRRGSNTGIFLYATGGGTEARYLVTDWGESMGRFGGYLDRDRWNCRDYTEQSSKWIAGVHKGDVLWAWSGNHTHDMTRRISVSDVQWLLQYLGRITDEQIRTGLEASGANAEEVGCFATAVRGRISRLRGISRVSE